MGKLHFKIKNLLTLSLFFISIFGYSQVVEETIQLDTITEKIKVIYRPGIINSTSHYTKKIGVFASDTSQVAIEKNYLRGQLNGIYKVNYPSGKPMVKAVMVGDTHNGEFTWYQEDGIIKIKGVYKYAVKHGFWAYKYLKIYGRYKNGKKHGRWYKVDANGQKIKSWYKYGKLVKGKGFETDETIPTIVDTTIKDIVANNQDSLNIDTNAVESNLLPFRNEYDQVFYYLKNNFILKKTLKAHFGEQTKNLLKFKKNYKSEVFQFQTCQTLLPLTLDHFVNKSNKGEIQVAKIDSVIKNTPNLASKFSEKSKISYDELSTYKSQITKKDPLISIYYSEVIDNLMRVEIVWNKDEKEFDSKLELFEQIEADKRFSVLLYFNKKGELAGAEYQ